MHKFAGSVIEEPLHTSVVERASPDPSRGEGTTCPFAACGTWQDPLVDPSITSNTQLSGQGNSPRLQVRRAAETGPKPEQSLKTQSSRGCWQLG